MGLPMTDPLYGKETRLAMENFPVSGEGFPRAALAALASLKSACAQANADLGLLDEGVAKAIGAAAAEVVAGEHWGEFPVDLFQTGSGTSTNMNMNEVLAARASQIMGGEVDAHDHVNMGQSSNDVVPSCIQVAAVLETHNGLLPALEGLGASVEAFAQRADGVVKTGRTHLMDALPIALSDEVRIWGEGLERAASRLRAAARSVAHLPLGGTAVGTGANAHPEMAKAALAVLSAREGVEFLAMGRPGRGLSMPDTLGDLSGACRRLALVLAKVANDLRWMNSGPLAGIGEIALPALQPGSSIMPGKVNPVIPESVAQVAAQVQGNDLAVAVAVGSGSFQLNVMFPVVARNLLESIGLLAAACRILGAKALAGAEIKVETITERLWRNPILATALNPVIGYDKAAAIAKRAYAEGRSVLAVAMEDTGMAEEELRRLMDPARLAGGE